MTVAQFKLFISDMTAEKKATPIAEYFPKLLWVLLHNVNKDGTVDPGQF